MRFLRLSATAAVAALAVTSAHAQQSAGEASDEGALIQIGPDKGVRVDVDWPEDLRERRLDRRRLRQPARAEAAVPVSRYWIGIAGGPLPEALRAQMRIGDDEGVLVRTVTEEGPAAEAGVERFDIILRANGKPVAEIKQLADLVGEQGELKGRITLDLLRAGKPKTLWVKPVERPMDEILAERPRRERLGLFGPEGRLRERLFNGEGFDLEQLQGMLGEGGFDPEMFGGLAEMVPQAAMNGVSVSVSRQNDGPAKVTVQRGDQTWEFDEGDRDALNQLPADVRPMVERMLNQNGRVVGDDLEAFGFGGPGFQLQFGDDLAERLRELQAQMQGLRGQLGDPAAPGGGEIAPEIELDEAPAFGGAPATDAAPAPTEGEEAGEEVIELEIPGDE